LAFWASQEYLIVKLAQWLHSYLCINDLDSRLTWAWNTCNWQLGSWPSCAIYKRPRLLSIFVKTPKTKTGARSGKERQTLALKARPRQEQLDAACDKLVSHEREHENKHSIVIACASA